MNEIIEGWVVLETLNYEHQAEMIRSQLEAAGIECTIFSQKDNVNVVFVGDLSEIKILVHQDNLAQAREIIKDMELPDLEISEDTDVGESTESDEEEESEIEEDEESEKNEENGSA